jgi:glycosyltransferase involved in cell wall biosynthesis
MRESISVIAPVRNLQWSIEDRAERLLEWICELCDEVQVIFVDDASSDETPEVLEVLRCRYPQIETHRQFRCIGPDSAAESAVHLTRGEWIFLQRSYAPIEADCVNQLWNMRRDPQLLLARVATRTLGSLERESKRADHREQHNRFEGGMAFSTGDRPDSFADGNPGLQMIRRRSLLALLQSPTTAGCFEVSHRSHRQFMRPKRTRPSLTTADSKTSFWLES